MENWRVLNNSDGIFRDGVLVYSANSYSNQVVINYAMSSLDCILEHVKFEIEPRRNAFVRKGILYHLNLKSSKKEDLEKEICRATNEKNLGLVVAISPNYFEPAIFWYFSEYLKQELSKKGNSQRRQIEKNMRKIWLRENPGRASAEMKKALSELGVRKKGVLEKVHFLYNKTKERMSPLHELGMFLVGIDLGDDEYIKACREANNEKISSERKVLQELKEVEQYVN